MASRAEYLAQRTAEMKENSELLSAANIEDSYMRGVHHIESQACRKEHMSREQVRWWILWFLTRKTYERY